MSAPPSGKPNGAPRPQKANPLRPMRKPQRANPLVASRRPVPKPSAPKPPTQIKPSVEEIRRANGGWSEPAPPNTTDIPIMTTKKALMDGIRYHMMKFSQSKMGEKPIDPLDQDEFARPVTLHRRDARQPPPGRAPKLEAPEQMPVDEQEAERLAQVKADREAQRAIDQAKIAPVAKDLNPKRPKKQKEEKTNFNRAPKTATAKKESGVRYAEMLPWHLEDADGKNVWVGSYVAALSETNVAFMIDQSVFRMVPLEKWYRFTAKPPFQPFTIDEAETLMGKKTDPARWIMRDEEKRAGQEDLEATRRMIYGRVQVKTESSTFRGSSRLEKLDHDEIDMSGDEFQDDDEAPLFERNDDEDTKESKDRIRREQLGANLFGDGDEQKVDRELHEQLREELERQRLGKATKKALIKRDREDIYASDDSADNPWSSSDEGSSSDEDEEEKDEKKEEEEKKEGLTKDGDAKDKDKEKGKGSKGASSSQGKGKSDGSKKAKSLKRSGSPTLSESSGNESLRKKLKKTAAPAIGSRSGTPLPQSTVRRPKVGGAGSGSDGEATGGEMSDGAGKKKKKLKLASNSARGTPSASRAGSPIPNQGGASPGPAGAAVVEGREILEQIPPGGISISELIKPFQGRVGEKPGQMPRTEWIKLVKEFCVFGQDKLLRRKP